MSASLPLKNNYIPMKKDIMQFWTKLMGSPQTHTLEAIIFHTACIFTGLLFICSIFFNYLIGLYTLSILLVPAVFSVSLVYYLSKFKYKLNLAITIFCVIGNLLFIAFFLNNSGINGPGLVIYLLFFFLVISIVPKSQRFGWMGVNIIVAISLILFQYYNPEAVPFNYKNDFSRHLDLSYVYFFTLIIIYFILTSIISSYNRERLLAEKRAEQLEIANQSKNKLFSILAHDLRSPLNSIQSFLEISMEMEIEEDEKRTINSSLLKETKYTGQMLINLLSWSKTQMEGVNVRLIRIELAKVLETTLLLQTSLAEEKGLTLNNRIQQHVHVIADRDMMELIIRNLINNAIKFTPAGGEITISSEIHGAECWIKIQDTGVGIARHDYDNIFSLHSESTYGTNQEKGVGLGLVLCKEFIAMQNGRIWVESTVNVGTAFFVSINLASQADLFPLHLN
ncbi:signal transduction histidine kinase [Pedobacter cryoconitis]|uniref:sensor histidine kinase n=1 Tax=Pedobacter cryoconitis TaxID=188932 RepID=UPI001621A3CA|nr:HAMP domain-containing sensor histidine kinase [Pedobacter cryoconitis]MBB6272748.1 signal transduction histidine kinase [Pedobacter cryoconitis]